MSAAGPAGAPVDDTRPAPWWYSTGLALLLSGFVASLASHHPVVISVAGVVYFVGFGVLLFTRGNRVPQREPGRGYPSTYLPVLLLLGAVVVAVGAGAVLDYGMGQRWGFLAAAAVLAPIGWWLARWYDARLRATLRDEAQPAP